MKNPAWLITILLGLIAVTSSASATAIGPVVNPNVPIEFEDGDYSVELPSCKKRNPEDAREFQQAFHDWATDLYWVDLDGDGNCDLITMQGPYSGPEVKGIPIYLASIMCFRYYNPQTDKFDIAKIKIGCGGERFVGGPAIALYYNKTAHRVEVANPPWFYSGSEGPYNHDSPLAWFHFRMMIRSSLLVQNLPISARCCGYGGQVDEMWRGTDNPNFPDVIFADIYPKRWIGYTRIPGLREKALRIQAEELKRIGGKPLFSEHDVAHDSAPNSLAK